MKKELSLKHLMHTAWVDFKKEWMSWVLLMAIGSVIVGLFSVGRLYYMPEEYEYIADIAQAFLSAIYFAILYQNGLDAVYGRKLSLITISSQILVASLFIFVTDSRLFIFESLDFLFLFLPQGFPHFFIETIHSIIYIVILYFFFRFMLVPMIVLHEKTTIMDALYKSFKLTSYHFFLLLRLYFYAFLVLMLLAVIIALCFVIFSNQHEFLLNIIVTISPFIGIIILPYLTIMYSLLYKQLNEMVK